jgi:putative oxidoreductase
MRCDELRDTGEKRRFFPAVTSAAAVPLNSNCSKFEGAMSNQSSHHNERTIMESTSVLVKLEISPHPVALGWYALPLRLIVGLGFIEHGYAKLSRGADAFIMVLHAIGVPFADLLGSATIAVEIIGGLLILFGAFVRIAALPMIIVLLVAIFTVHLPNGFSSIKLMSYDAAGAHFGQPGYETDLLYVAALVALCIGGAGPFSLDAYLTRILERRRAASAQLGRWNA